jgi:hypothetical protein
MRQIPLRILLGTIASLLATPMTGFADQLFHSVRLPFVLTLDGENADNPPLRSGHVIDIHPNGPVYGAHERYVVNGAKPNHRYDVVLRIFADDEEDCQGTPTDFDPLPTATLVTNQNGVAHGKFDFPAGDPLEEPLFVWVYWTLVEPGSGDDEDTVAYQTDCILVGIDSL